MSETKKYFWLKLQKTFFDDVKVKMLRKIAGGDTYTIIYLKLMLETIDHDGELKLEGITEDPIQEISILIDESEDNIRACLELLHSLKLCETNGDNLLFYEVIANTGKETSSARRVREHRANQKMLQCNTDVTKCNTELEKELDLKLEKDIYGDKPQTQKSKSFIAPTLEQVQEYCKERNNNVNAERFIDFYTSKGWCVGKNKMKDWKASVRTWEQNSKEKSTSSPKQNNWLEKERAANDSGVW